MIYIEKSIEKIYVVFLENNLAVASVKLKNIEVERNLVGIITKWLV
jgi:hypothetical protein